MPDKGPGKTSLATSKHIHGSWVLLCTPFVSQLSIIDHNQWLNVLDRQPSAGAFWFSVTRSSPHIWMVNADCRTGKIAGFHTLVACRNVFWPVMQGLARYTTEAAATFSGCYQRALYFLPFNVLAFQGHYCLLWSTFCILIELYPHVFIRYCSSCVQYAWKLLHPTDKYTNRECPDDAEEYERVGERLLVLFCCNLRLWTQLMNIESCV